MTEKEGLELRLSQAEIKIDNMDAHIHGLREELAFVKSVLDRANEANRILARENEHLRSIFEKERVSEK